VPRKKRTTGTVPWGEVAEYDFLVDDLIFRLFGAAPHEFMVTDDSRLSDFCGWANLDALPAAHRKIFELYGIDSSALPDDYIKTIVKEIARSR
jgi:hypothetical protein